jgi:hypothetical protein
MNNTSSKAVSLIVGKPCSNKGCTFQIRKNDSTSTKGGGSNIYRNVNRVVLGSAAPTDLGDILTLVPLQQVVGTIVIVDNMIVDRGRDSNLASFIFQTNGRTISLLANQPLPPFPESLSSHPSYSVSFLTISHIRCSWNIVVT